MQYAILTSTGFQMAGSEAAVYETEAEALGVAAPGDQIIPILGDDEVTISYIGS